ncbi:beta-ketoacyl-ACP synthase II [uncultured Desulfobulbus sp.]|uniref:beta-ketoacyl-ACP synthase II n=1 Tax=uncultured Desulfobulbus sp. TaxID=239745 RepID=UPI0029C69906|nr:beta-ketoacyl-ACP synthase II [uncultured Desulfobulbus sp.]
MKRAVITGLGPVTPIGTGVERFWAGLKGNESAVRRITLFDPSPFKSQIAGEVRDFDPTDYLERKALKRMDRFSQFAVVATRLAIEDASLDIGSLNSDRLGVSIGSALGGIGFAEKQLGVYHTEGLRSVDPSLALSVFCGAGSCNIAIDVGCTGPVTANSNSCASGTIALGEALEFIRSDQADVVLAGGSESPLSPLCFGAFAIIKAMSCRNDDPEHACRPFDAGRDGFVMGEGATVLVVEELEHALNRGAHIYAEIAGHSLTNDAYQMMAPRPDGKSASRAMSLALSNAGVAPEDIDYISAHGSSTPLNDKSETLAIKTVFGDRAYCIPISSTKGHHAHALGATGAFEAAACALALEHGFIPPTLNLDSADPECDLNYMPNQGCSSELRTVLSNSFGFGGINACLVLKRND